MVEEVIGEVLINVRILFCLYALLKAYLFNKCIGKYIGIF